MSSLMGGERDLTLHLAPPPIKLNIIIRLKDICTKPEDGHTQGPKHVVSI